MSDIWLKWGRGGVGKWEMSGNWQIIHLVRIGRVERLPLPTFTLHWGERHIWWRSQLCWLYPSEENHYLKGGIFSCPVTDRLSGSFVLPEQDKGNYMGCENLALHVL